MSSPSNHSSALCLITILMLMTVSVLAQDTPQPVSACSQQEVDQKKEKCADQMKRTQLKIKKLTPEVRAVELKRDRAFNWNKLYPFMAGSGLIY